MTVHLPTNPPLATSTSVPRPISTFEPISPQQLKNSTENQNTESSPQSSLPCGQRTPASSTSTSDTPSQHTLHSCLYTHNHNHITLHQCITHHQNTITHKTYNIHLLRQIIIHLPSLPFQMKNNSMYPNQQILVK